MWEEYGKGLGKRSGGYGVRCKDKWGGCYYWVLCIIIKFLFLLEGYMESISVGSRCMVFLYLYYKEIVLNDY